MQHPLHSSVRHLDHADTRIHVIDTPGGPDFLGHGLPALEAVETAAAVINAATGIEPVAVRMMAYAASRHQDGLIIVNEIDLAAERPPALMEQIRTASGTGGLPLNLPPDGEARVVDCFCGRDGQSDRGSADPAHRALVEQVVQVVQVVEVDPGFVARDLTGGDVDVSELHAPLEQALRDRHLIPVCFVSARRGAGVAEWQEVIVKLLPNPTEANPPDFLKSSGSTAVPMHTTPDAALDVVAHVFKINSTPMRASSASRVCTWAPSRATACCRWATVASR